MLNEANGTVRVAFELLMPKEECSNLEEAEENLREFLSSAFPQGYNISGVSVWHPPEGSAP